MTRKVIHYTDSDGWGGAEQVMLTLLAGPDRDRWEPVLLHHGGEGTRLLVEGAEARGVRTRVVGLASNANTLRQVTRIVQIMREERPAVFHAHLNWPLACKSGLAAAIAARVRGVCATEHSFVDVPIPRSRYVQRVLSMGVDRYIAVSYDLARRLHRTFHFPASKVEVIHNGIPLQPFDQPPDPSLRAALNVAPEQALVVTVARLHEQKGLRYLLDAAVSVPEAVFVLVGDGPHRTQFEDQAHALGIAERVRFLGLRHDVANILYAADVFVLPSMFEGLPLSVLEAMAAGKPVVATAVGGVGEAVDDGLTGVLVPPADPLALATAILSVLSDRDLARTMGEAGQHRCRAEFAAPIMVERTSHLYDEILGGQRSGRS